MSLANPRRPLSIEEEKYCELVGTGSMTELEAIREVWPKYTQSYQYHKHCKLSKNAQIQDRISEHTKKLFSSSALRKQFRAWQRSTLHILQDPDHTNWASASATLTNCINKQIEREQGTLEGSPKVEVNFTIERRPPVEIKK